MEQADKFSYATTSGICTIFASCVGGHMYHDSHKSGIYSEDKYICGYYSDTFIMFSSAITGLMRSMAKNFRRSWRSAWRGN